MAGEDTVGGVAHRVETGEIDPDGVHRPSTDVRRIDVNANPKQRIETRTPTVQSKTGASLP